MNRYTTPAAPTAPAAEPFMVESRVPAGPSRFETHVQVPVALAGIITLAVTFGLAIGTWRFGWPWDITWIGGLVVFIVVLAWRLLWVDHLAWRIETLTRVELDGKPGIGKPHDLTLLNMGDYTPPAPNLPDMTTEDGTPTKRALMSFVMSCYVMGRTSERAHGIKPWDRKRYKNFRDSLIDKLRIAQWDDAGNHNLGWHMVVDQDTALRTIDKYVL